MWCRTSHGECVRAEEGKMGVCCCCSHVCALLQGKVGGCGCCQWGVADCHHRGGWGRHCVNAFHKGGSEHGVFSCVSMSRCVKSGHSDHQRVKRCQCTRV